MFFENLTTMFSDFSGWKNILFIALFAIPLGIFLYRSGKNLGRIITLISDLIKKISKTSKKE